MSTFDAVPEKLAPKFTSTTASASNMRSTGKRVFVYDSVAAAQFVGAFFFLIGSCGFAWMSFCDTPSDWNKDLNVPVDDKGEIFKRVGLNDWLLALRIGAGTWIAGCVPYLWPPLKMYLPSKSGSGSDEKMSWNDHAGAFLQTAGMVAWAIGSAYAFRASVEKDGSSETDVGYLIGSSCLLVDALVQMYCSHMATVESDERKSMYGDLAAGVFYVVAGALSLTCCDNAALLGLFQFGNCCWVVGSVFSFTRPCLALYPRGEDALLEKKASSYGSV